MRRQDEAAHPAMNASSLVQQPRESYGHLSLNGAAPQELQWDWRILFKDNVCLSPGCELVWVAHRGRDGEFEGAG